MTLNIFKVSLQLPEHLTQLSDSNFLTRMLYTNTYSLGGDTTAPSRLYARLCHAFL